MDALAVLAAAAAADGQLQGREVDLMEAFARKHGIPREEGIKRIEAARSGQADLPRPKDAAEAEACLRGLIQTCLADGRVSDQETAMLAAFGRGVGLAPDQVRAMVQEERADLFERAKEVLAA